MAGACLRTGVIAVFVCEKCGAEFVSQEEYRDHKQDHNLGKVKDKDYETLLKEQGGDDIQAEPVKSPAPKQKASRPWVDDMEERKQSKIELVYHYEGWCNDCGGELQTITLDDVVDDKNKVVLVAWCKECGKKMRQRTVAKL